MTMCEDFKRKLADLDDMDENFIAQKPWAQKHLEIVLKMTKKAVLNWCRIVCKIGENEVDLENYISIFQHEVKNLYEEMITDVEALEQKKLEKIMNSLERLEKLCCMLHIEIPQFNYEEVPLGVLETNVMQRIEDYETLFDNRKREWQDLHQKQLKLCRNLGRDPQILVEFPEPKQIEELRTYVEELEIAAMEREEKFFQLKEEIVSIAGELGSVPSLDFEREILDLTDAEVRIGDQDMEALERYHERLVAQKQTVKEEIGELRNVIDSLWDKLETNIGERDEFRQKYVGNSLETLRVLHEEVKKLEEIKKANIKMFICNQRKQLAQLWDDCHCTQNERQAFRFGNSECYNEDLFELHEREIEKWKSYYEENKDMFGLIGEYKKLWEEQKMLESNEGGRNRYKNRGGQLLREEKQRNKLKKQIPLVEQELKSRAETYLLWKGKEFLTFGQTVEELINKMHEEAEKEFKLKLSAKKLQREQASTVGSSRMNLFPGTASHLLLTPSAAKRKIKSAVTEPAKRSRLVSQSIQNKNPQTGRPKFNVSIGRRRSARREKLRQRLSYKNQDSCKENLDVDYDVFQQEVSSNFQCRSTGFGLKMSPTKEELLQTGVTRLPLTPRQGNKLN